MSSFFAHGLAGFSVFAFDKKPESFLSKKLWLLWLIIIACAPDIDYIFRGLRLTSDSEQQIRITHSILLSLLLPCLTILLLTIIGCRGNTLKIRSRQVILAGVSHLFLDFLVGVYRLPLLFPFSMATFTSSFGILPSAGRLNLFNYFLYRNLLIEIGILMPLFASGYLIKYNRSNTLGKKLIITGLLIISLCFTLWSISLSR